MRKASLVPMICLLSLFVFTGTELAQAVMNSGREALEYLVDYLPEDNLIHNPWFRTGSRPSLDGWVEATISDGGWTASQKPGNPTPDDIVGTAARISTGRGDRLAGHTVNPGVDTYLYQIVAADSAKRTLKFDMHWVTHTVNPVVVTVYAGLFPEGPWEEIWKPFYQVHTKIIIPPSLIAQDLWQYYSSITDLATVTLEEGGYSYYKVEIKANLPDLQGGLKITGVYFAVE